jgi:L-fuculose-phosphate aldolase
MAAQDRQRLREAVVAACRAMNASGINQGMSGNVSVRHGRGCLITPSAVPYETMEPDQVVALSLGGRWRGDRRPSSEWRMHVDIYRERPEAGAVIHAHPTFCTALACLHEPIPPFHYMVAVAGGDDVRCARYATFGTRELSRHMLEALSGRSACLLANHGLICFGDDLDHALWRAVEVEALARQYWHARMLGTPVLLDRAQMDEVHEQFRNYRPAREKGR